MTIDLGQYEAGTRPAGDPDVDVAVLERRLARVQAAHVVHGRRSIVVLEGWDAGGKAEIARRLSAPWDARGYRLWPIAAPTAEERRRHFLTRFWAKLPGAGEIALFDRSWYGRVVADRVAGIADPRQVTRGYDEINEFEAQQKDEGTAIVKIFVHVSQAEQDARILKRLADPWQRWKVTPDDLIARDARAAQVAAWQDAFAATDMRWARWTAIDGNNRKAARIAAMTLVADRLEKHVPMAPPAVDDEVLWMARDRFGDAVRG